MHSGSLVLLGSAAYYLTLLLLLARDAKTSASAYALSSLGNQILNIAEMFRSLQFSQCQIPETRASIEQKQDKLEGSVALLNGRLAGVEAIMLILASARMNAVMRITDIWLHQSTSWKIGQQGTPLYCTAFMIKKP